MDISVWLGSLLGNGGEARAVLEYGGRPDEGSRAIIQLGADRVDSRARRGYRAIALATVF